MTRSELIDHLADKTYLAKAEVKRVVDGVFDAIIDAATRGEEIAINNFGKFAVRRSAARDGRNPRTGEITPIKASTRLTFKPGKAVKDRLNP
ncbi:MAG: HU family DNA-binding protein [Altererythrobacter sp.]|nr:HU family DNA-binding protein [Altererythrobacter sp.]